MMLTTAKQYLRDVAAKKKAVPYTRYNKKLPHRHGLVNSFCGRYPIKASQKILDVLESAQSNAENKGLDVDRLRIIHAAAYQGMKLKRYKPRAQGNASPKFDTTTHVEIVLDEKPAQGEQ
jgi:large subunit ribosomal protein L22